jgi:hypothetical protein
VHDNPEETRMAAKPTKPPDSDGKINFTMIKFGMEGSDAAIQKGIETFKATLVQAGFIQVQEPVRQLRAAPVKQLNGASQEVEPETAEESASEVVDEVVDATPAAPRASTPRAKPKIKNYTAIEDPGFNTTTPTLKEFAAAKSPNADAKRFLVIAYWFKNYLNKPSVTNEGFYTAFRAIGWTVPTNIAQHVRELRSSRNQRLIKGTDPNSSAISHLGENAVDELGKGEA